MIDVLTLLAALAAGVGGGALVAPRLRRRPSGWLEQRTAEHLIVHTTKGQTLAGLVREVTPDGVLMSAVTLVDTGAEMAGDVFLPRGLVLMAQRVKASS